MTTVPLKIWKFSHRENIIDMMWSQTYIHARNLLWNSDWFWFIFSAIFLMHHSIECYIKAVLQKNWLKWPYWAKWHELISLLEIFNQSSILKSVYLELNSDPDIMDLLRSLTDNYTQCKYLEAWFNIDWDKLRDSFDKVIFILHSNLYEWKDDRAKSIDVPSTMVDFVDCKNKQPFVWCVI